MPHILFVQFYYYEPCEDLVSMIPGAACRLNFLVVLCEFLEIFMRDLCLSGGQLVHHLA